MMMAEVKEHVMFCEYSNKCFNWMIHRTIIMLLCDNYEIKASTAAVSCHLVFR